MKRSGAEFPPPENLRSLLDDKGRIAVRATPGARQDAISIHGNQLAAKVRARPQEGAANQALVEILARAFGVPKSRCHLLRGQAAREKLFLIEI